MSDPHETLAVVDMPGLRVALVAISGPAAAFIPGAMPAIAPLTADEPHPLPADLPVGLEPRRLGEGYCAVDASGDLAVSWIDLPLPPSETLYLAWDLGEGPPPALEALIVGGHAAAFVAAAWSAASRERLPLLVVRASRDSCWLVGGRLARLDLVRVAASLPQRSA